MIWFLSVIGLLLVIYGGYLIKKENIEKRGESFNQILEDKREDRDGSVELAAITYEMQARLASVEDKLDKVLLQVAEIQQGSGRAEDDHSLVLLNENRGEVQSIRKLLKDLR